MDLLLRIGQWAPIAGTGFAALGSLYLFLADTSDPVDKVADRDAPMHHCDCMHSQHNGEQHLHSHRHTDSDDLQNRKNIQSDNKGDFVTSPRPDLALMQKTGEQGISPASSHSAISQDVTGDREREHGRYNASIGLTPTNNQPPPRAGLERSETKDVANRRKIAKGLKKISNYMGTAAPDLFNEAEFKNSKALDYPEIPAEEARNRILPQIRTQYNLPRDNAGHVTPALQGRSRAASFVGSAHHIEHSPAGSRAPSIERPQSAHRRSPSPSPTGIGRAPAKSLPAEANSFELQTHQSQPSTPSAQQSQRPRRDTLEVPIIHHSVTLSNPPAASPRPSITVPTMERLSHAAREQSSPAIMVSASPDTISPPLSPLLNRTGGTQGTERTSKDDSDQ